MEKENGDWSYVLNMNGDVLEYLFEDDMRTIEQGNVFLTRKEAEKEAKRRKIHQELKKLAGGYEFGRGENNYFIYFNVYRNILEVLGFSNTYLANIVYFETEERAQNAIKEIGEEVLLRDYFGIDEE